MEPSLIALLGRREKPTDGVEDYCKFLSEALGRQGISTKLARVEWEELGWISALRKLRKQSSDWRGAWVVVHYTALSWSRRGFPVGVLFVLAALRRRGLRCAVLFHEAAHQSGRSRLRDRIRGDFQDWVIRGCFHRADKAIFTVPLDLVPWLRGDFSKACYIPIGANIPERIAARASDQIRGGGRDSGASATVAVFCISPGDNRFVEIAEMALAAERVVHSTGKVRFIVLGKGSTEAREEISAALREKGAEVCVLGQLSAEQVADSLAGADVLLYLTGWVAQNRGSALAGVACGLPIVGYSGASHEPIQEAGVELVAYRDREALAEALVRVLTDDVLRSELRRKSVVAQQRHFSWDSIAGRYASAFDPGQRAIEGAQAASVTNEDETLRSRN
jgi:glycosyltransferase involved in cell wall biosynthesis